MSVNNIYGGTLRLSRPMQNGCNVSDSFTYLATGTIRTLCIFFTYWATGTIRTLCIFSEIPYLIWEVIKTIFYMCFPASQVGRLLLNESEFSALQNNFLPYKT